MRARATASICCSPPLMLPASCRRRSRRIGKGFEAETRGCGRYRGGPPPGRPRARGSPRRSASERAAAPRAPWRCPDRRSPPSTWRVRSIRPPSVSRTISPRVRAHHPHDALEQGALAVAVGAEEGNRLALADLDRHAVQHAHRHRSRASTSRTTILLAKVGLLHGRVSERSRPGVPSAIRAPASRTTIRSEKRITARMMCSIMMMVMPCAFRRKRMAQNVVHLGAGQSGHRLVRDE